MGGLRRLDAVVSRTFTDERLRRLFSFQALYAGVAPQQALAVLAVISYMDVVAGVWYPTRRHPLDRHRAGRRRREGGRAHPLRRSGRAHPAGRRRLAVGCSGVATADGVLAADAVVCNADLPGAYGLVPGLTHAAPAAAPALLAVGAGVARRRARPAAGRHRPSQHPLRRASGPAASVPSSTRACACPIRRCS